MDKINFMCDYAEGAHPAILDALVKTNMEQTVGYGLDGYCDTARARIKTACDMPGADVHFLVGGTQTNTTVIAALLRPYQGVISGDAGHIAVHETGAIEGTGHKVLCLPSENGKIKVDDVSACLEAHFTSEIAEHTVMPGMVYLTYPTECGTLYSKAELTEIRALCRRYEIPLFIDGARLGYGLTSPACDLTLPELARLCDVFYIGGTKCGCYFGEAVVITNDAYKKGFRYMIKRQGGLFAKGRLLGIQFATLFENDLYFNICAHAVTEALRIRAAFAARGVEFFGASMTNQQFPILKKAQRAYFEEKYLPEFWCDAADGKEVVRFCTSWATKTENVDALIEDIKKMPQ